MSPSGSSVAPTPRPTPRPPSADRRARLPTTPQRRIRASPPGRRPGGPEGPPGSGRTPHPAGRRRARERVVARRRTALGRRLDGVGRSPAALRRGGELAATAAAAPPHAPPSADGTAGAAGAPRPDAASTSAGARRSVEQAAGACTRSRCRAARRERERGSNSGPCDHYWRRRGGGRMATLRQRKRGDAAAAPLPRAGRRPMATAAIPWGTPGAASTRRRGFGRL